MAVDRASPWIALVIIGREFTILGLRGRGRRRAGAHLETSMLGKWKATIQFAALTIAMLRPDVTIAGAYLDEWGMVFAAIVTAWSGVDYLLKFSASLRTDLVSRVFVTGGSGVIGGALVERLVARGDDVVALARSDEAAAALQGRGAEVARGDVLDEAALVRGMEGAELAFHVAGINAFCVEDPEPMRRVNVDGAVAAVRAAAAAGVPRLVHTSSAATLGEPPGTVGREDTPHRGWYLSAYERTKTEGERAVLAAAAQTGQDVVCVNPSSVQGPGRAGGTGRFLLAFLDGRMKVFVQTNVSLVDIADCVEGHLLAAERGQAGERYLLNGMTLTLTEALALAAEVAGVQRTPRLLPRPVATVAAGVAERGFRLPGAIRRSAARWSARCCTATATTARAPSASSACATPTRPRPCGARSTGRARPGC